MKYEKLVHYICQKTKEDPSKLGAVKLNKILWFSDIFSYLQNGKSITNEQYVKNKHGPVPKKVAYIIEKLKNEEKIAIKKEAFHGYIQKRYISLTEADETFLSEPEKKIVDDVIQAICDNHTAVSISELTHDEIWEMADNGEEIPLSTIFSHKPGFLSQSDFEWASKILRKYVLNETYH